MAFQDIIGKVLQLQVANDALAAIGAAATTKMSGAELAPDVAEAFDRVLHALDLDAIAELEPQELAVLAGVVRTSFAQAEDLLVQPARAPGWQYTDPMLLEGQGRGSALLPALIDRTVPLGEVRQFLDLGTGVGRLAIAAAAVWPQCQVVGIDTWEPSLELARANVAEAGLETRVELRKQDVVDLDDVDRFDCAWLPTFFFARDFMPRALRAVRSATRPGGAIMLGLYASPPDPTAQATAALRTVRDGGCVLDGDGAAALLRDAGWVDVAAAPREGDFPVHLVVGRRPA